MLTDAIIAIVIVYLIHKLILSSPIVQYVYSWMRYISNEYSPKRLMTGVSLILSDKFLILVNIKHKIGMPAAIDRKSVV